MNRAIDGNWRALGEEASDLGTECVDICSN
jgi:hypothetical protein